MYVKQVVLFGLLYLSCCCCIRIWRHKSSCDRHGTGFLCLPKIGDKRTVIFECPFKHRDYHIYINEFSGPKTLETLIIKNCKSLTVLLRCTKYAWERKNLKYLVISNIEKLKIQNVALYQSLLPPTVVFENIKSIENIPSHTFTQTNKKLNLIRCVLPNYNFTSIHFRNVSINRIQAKAFYMPNGFGNVTFTNVKIRALDTSSIIINQEGSGVFKVEHSLLGLVKGSAIQVVAEKTVFSNNKFAEISPAGIRVKSDVFNFVNNSIEGQFHNQGLAVASRHTIVSYNRFSHLKTGAFSGIGSSEKIGYYEFVGNVMDFLEDDSLLPKSYSQVTVQRNTFSCECYKSGWLLSKIGRKGNVTTADAFYRKIFDERSENICSSTCSLPINAAQAKIVHGKCTNSISITAVCAATKKNEAKEITVSPKSNTTPVSPKLSTLHISGIHVNNSTVVVPIIYKMKVGSKTTTLPTTNKEKTFNATNKLINEEELIKKTTQALPTPQKVTTSPTVSLTQSYNSTTDTLKVPSTINTSINKKELIKTTTQALLTPQKVTTPTVSLSKSYNSTTDKLKIFNTTNKSINEKEVIEMTTLTPQKVTTSSTVSLTKVLPINHTYETFYTESTLSENPYTVEEKLDTKNTSPPIPTEHEVSFNTNYTMPSTSPSESFSSISSTEYTEGTTQTELISSTEENVSSSSSLETSVMSLQQTTSSNLFKEDEITSSSDISTEENSTSSFETSLASDLTTATFSVTTLPTTKHKSAIVKETVQWFTLEYNATTHRQQYIQATATSKRLSTPFHGVTTADSSSNQITENCSNIYSLSPFILLFILSVALNNL